MSQACYISVDIVTDAGFGAPLAIDSVSLPELRIAQLQPYCLDAGVVVLFVLFAKTGMYDSVL